jgi:putative ABC transport system substrate-binding protein
MGSSPAGSPARVGVFFMGDATHRSFAGFRQGLVDAGLVEGRDVDLLVRCTTDPRALPELAAALVAERPAVIAVIGAVALHAMERLGGEVPLVFTVVLDPVAAGLVPAMQRPGGRVTGVTNFDPGQAARQVALLRELILGLSRLAILGDADVPVGLAKANVEAAEAAGLVPQLIELRDPADLDAAFDAFRAGGAQALLVLEVPFTNINGRSIAERAIAARLPHLFFRDGLRHGPMVAYGTPLGAASRRMAALVRRVLDGTPAGEIPAEIVAAPELVLDRRVAEAMGVALPPALLARADQVLG